MLNREFTVYRDMLVSRQVGRLFKLAIVSFACATIACLNKYWHVWVRASVILHH